MELIKFDLISKKISVVKVVGETKTLYRLENGESIKKNSLYRFIYPKMSFVKQRYIYLERDCWRVCREAQRTDAKERYTNRKSLIKWALKQTCYKNHRNTFNKVMR